jgi:carbonic anhydrase
MRRAMQRLLDGYRRFQGNTWPQFRGAFHELAKAGQHPHTLVIACSDSRVDPQMIFDSEPGELFVIRNVAALVPPYAPDAAYHGTSAALEFGVRALNVANLVVMGHDLCGGIAALLEGAPAEVPDFVGGWVEIAAAAREEAFRYDEPAVRRDVCEHEAVKVSLTNLMTFPWVRERVEAGTLMLHGARFDVGAGVLEWLGQDGTFSPL